MRALLEELGAFITVIVAFAVILFVTVAIASWIGSLLGGTA